MVRSPNWDNGSESDAGAVTWCSGITGCNGVVSISNSLVGTTGNDMKGANTNVIALSNGNYVVINPNWVNGDGVGAGAVTWCDGLTGCSGEISAANSLVGSAANNMVGFYGITVLKDDRYIVRSPYWDHGTVINAGALTWCSGESGCVGEISATNSLIGASTNDLVGYNPITVLSNGNNVVQHAGLGSWECCGRRRSDLVQRGVWLYVEKFQPPTAWLVAQLMTKRAVLLSFL